MEKKTKKKLLLVEDENSIGSVVKARLEKAGYEIVWSKDGEDGIYQVRSNQFDMILLDMNLPKVTGMEFLKVIRGENYLMPIMILSADRLLEDRIKALESGADDYLVKPFDFGEVVARIEANLRRTAHATPQIVHCGDMQIDLKNRTLSFGTTKLEVSDIEFRLMEYLANNADRPLSRSEIAKQIWGHENYSESNVIDVYLGYLMKALEKAGRPDFIKETDAKEFFVSNH
jgi:DNA-binding response OmpR family regulator